MKKPVSDFINELLDEQLSEGQQCIVLDYNCNLIGGDNVNKECTNSNQECEGNNERCTNTSHHCLRGNNSIVCANTGLTPPTNGMICK